MGKFQSGESGNPKGRKPGSRNKSSEAIRSAIRNFIEDNIDDLQADYKSLKPVERFKVIDAMLGFVLPPPISLDRLTEAQLEELFEQVKIKFETDDKDKDIEGH